MGAAKKYYISTGEETKMYTLRAAWSQSVVYYSEHHMFPETAQVPRDQYIVNLSTDPERAKTAALAYANENNINESQVNLRVDFDLDEIRRRNAAEMEAARDKAEKEREDGQKCRENEQINAIIGGSFPFGKYRDRAFLRIWEEDPDYIHYWLEREHGEDAYSVAIALTNVLRAQFKRRSKSINEHFGTKGEKYKGINLTLVKDAFYRGQFGIVNIYTFHDDQGRALVYKGAKYLELKEGETRVVNFKIKDHDEYEGDAQTLIYYLKFQD